MGLGFEEYIKDSFTVIDMVGAVFFDFLEDIGRGGELFKRQLLIKGAKLPLFGEIFKELIESLYFFDVVFKKVRFKISITLSNCQTKGSKLRGQTPNRE